MGGKKVGGGFLGIGGQSGLLNTGFLSSGPQKVKGFSMDVGLRDAEIQMIKRQNAIASGQAPSIAQMQMNQATDQNAQAALAMAASQRGSSNPMLAFRQAQLASQQAGLESSQQAAILAEQERRQAEQLIAAQAASQRGVAFQQSTSNLNAKMANQKIQADSLAALGGAAAKASSGGAG